MQIEAFWWKCCCVGADHTSPHVQPNHMDGSSFLTSPECSPQNTCKSCGRKKTDEYLLDEKSSGRSPCLPDSEWRTQLNKPSSNQLSRKHTGFEITYDSVCERWPQLLRCTWCWSMAAFTVHQESIQETAVKPKPPSAFSLSAPTSYSTHWSKQ